MLSITDGERAEDSGMNMRLAYTAKHIQKGLTLLGNYWLKNEDGLLIGYDPKKIHNVAEPPPVNEEDLPSCPVLK